MLCCISTKVFLVHIFRNISNLVLANPFLSIFFPLGIAFFSVAMICFFYTNAKLLIIFGLLELVFVLLLYRVSLFVILMAFSSLLVGTLIYSPFVLKGWIIYNVPTPLLGMPIWDPIILASAYILLAQSSLSLYENFKKQCSQKQWFYFLCIGIIVLFAYVGFVLSVVSRELIPYILGLIVLLLIFANKPLNLVIFWFSAFWGTIAEIAIVSAGAWSYPRAYFTDWGIPLTHPLAYGAFVNFFWVIAMLLSRFFRHEPSFLSSDS